MWKLQHLKSAPRRQEEMPAGVFFWNCPERIGGEFLGGHVDMAVNRAFFGLVGATLEGERLEERARELAGRASGRARRAHFTETLHPGGD